MIHLLLVYDLIKGEVLFSQEFTDIDRELALEKRFSLEREHSNDASLEVIVLSAPNRAALEATHARYFKNVQELASD